MSVVSRARRKQMSNFNTRLRINGGADRTINKWSIIDIHGIPDTIMPGNEFDFWCHNGCDLYLLRITCSNRESLSIFKTKGKGHVIYLIAETTVKNIDNKLISSTLGQFESQGIPKFTLDNLKIQL